MKLRLDDLLATATPVAPPPSSTPFEERLAAARMRRDDLLRHLNLSHKFHGQLMHHDGIGASSGRMLSHPGVIVPVPFDDVSLGLTIDCVVDEGRPALRVRRMFKAGVDRDRYRTVLFETDKTEKAERFVFDLYGGKKPKWMDEELAR